MYGSYDAVLDNPDVDAVYVPLPTSLHLRWAVLAAQKKKHLLLEKPVALNVGELDKILEACESNGVQYMDATNWMHHPRTSQMFQFLSDPQHFGRLQSRGMYIFLLCKLIIETIFFIVLFVRSIYRLYYDEFTSVNLTDHVYMEFTISCGSTPSRILFTETNF